MKTPLKKKIKTKIISDTKNKQKCILKSATVKSTSTSSAKKVDAVSQIRRRSNRDASKNASLINSFIIDDVYEEENNKWVEKYFL